VRAISAVVLIHALAVGAVIILSQL
jgi:hypothetical protein